MREFRGEHDGRNVATARQRIARADRAEKFAIEILRIVFAETMRRVGQDRQGMNQPLFHCQRVNERLQSRTGRTRAARAINLTVDLDLAKIGGTNLRQDVHGSDIDKQGGGILDSAVAIYSDVIGDAPLDELLLSPIQRGDDFVRAFAAFQNLLNKMRREKCAFVLGARLEKAAGEFRRRCPFQLRSYQLFWAELSERLSRSARQRAPGRALRNHAQRDCFGSGQSRGGFAEINLGWPRRCLRCSGRKARD